MAKTEQDRTFAAATAQSNTPVRAFMAAVMQANTLYTDRQEFVDHTVTLTDGTKRTVSARHPMDAMERVNECLKQEQRDEK